MTTRVRRFHHAEHDGYISAEHDGYFAMKASQ
jgi:hypothetical protein